MPNFSGLLYRKGNVETPLFSAISGNAKVTNSVKFVTGQSYETGSGTQPAISETASLTAPDPTYTTTTQNINVTQIFQESFGVSDAKLSNMGTLSGINIANQQANPLSVIDFQTARKMEKIAQDIEYTFVNGVYQEATDDSTANKTKGVVNAAITNVMDNGGKPLSIWQIAEIMATMRDNGAPIDSLALWVDSVTLLQLNADAANNGLTAVPNAREVNGIKLSSLITPMGEIFLRPGKYLPAGTAMLLNLGVMAPVEQRTPNKGNFYREQLAKTGAGEKYQIFGQMGLDYGPEHYHGKITNISTAFETPQSGRAVYITAPVGTVETTAELIGAKLNKSTVAADDTAKVAVASTQNTITPATAPTLSYLWQVRAKTGTIWNDLTSSYTGYNTSELTVKAADAEKHYRCKVTASGSVTGTVYSDECTVEAAG